VIIHNIDIEGISSFPTKADPPLVIDPDTVLPFPIPLQRFEPVPRWGSEIVEAFRLVQVQELAPGDPLDGAERGHILILE
jgi:hypothetical protein